MRAQIYVFRHLNKIRKILNKQNDNINKLKLSINKKNQIEILGLKNTRNVTQNLLEGLTNRCELAGRSNEGT